MRALHTFRDVVPPRKPQRELVAIVGMSCRFPGSPTLETFWNLIARKKSAVGPVPADRFTADELPERHKKPGAFLKTEQIKGFDHRALCLLKKEARQIDPQHRMLLELAWEALEDAGSTLEQVAQSRTGVFLGLQWNDYFRQIGADQRFITAYSVLGNDFGLAANRISYAFDLVGPSQVVSSACISSHVALQTACQHIALGEIEGALVGASELMVSPDSLIAMDRTGMLSPSGESRSFSKDGDGFVRGEGGGMVYLKPLSRVQPHERVYAVVHAVDVSHNGKTQWIMAPSERGQKNSLSIACQKADINPSDLSYVEMHAPGKAAADTLEAQALSPVGGCAVGSVKPNIGHLGPASGIAGLIKLALSLRNGYMPPTRCKEPNPALPPHVEVLTQKRKWEGESRLAALTSLSLGGANAHAIVGSYEDSSSSKLSSSLYILPISARCEGALRDLALAYATQLRKATDKEVADICFTAQVGRSHHGVRLAVSGPNRHSLIKALTQWMVDGTTDDRLLPGDQRSLVERYRDGADVDWTTIAPLSLGRITSLPTYPWQRQECWVPNKKPAPAPATAKEDTRQAEGSKRADIEKISSSKAKKANTHNPKWTH